MKCLICGVNEVEDFMKPGGDHPLAGQGICFRCAQKILFERGIITYEEYIESIKRGHP